MLAEKRKADRAKMAAMVQALCLEMGATCKIRDNATHIWEDGSRPSPENRQSLDLAISLSDATVGIEFDGGPFNSQPNVFCMPWNVDHRSDKRFSLAFGRAVGSTVNESHGRKCMGFAGGIDALLVRLRAAMDCVNRGEAFLKDGEALPFTGASHDPTMVRKAGFQPIGDPAFRISATCYQRVAFEQDILQSELTAFRHPDGFWQMYRKPVSAAA